MLSVVRPPYLLRKYYQNFVWNIPTQNDEIFLTFDDGPIPEITEFVLDELKKYNALATFFCVGANVAAHPTIFQKIIDEGHSVGNHTYNHLNGWKTPTQEYINDIQKASELIPSNLFRPPYGKIKRAQTKLINDQYKIVMWDVLSYDFDSTTSTYKCLENVIQYTRPGSVIVFHDSLKAAKNLKYVLPKTLNYFTARKFKFSTIQQP